jgi:acyl-CoA thioester hydrolase
MITFNDYIHVIPIQVRFSDIDRLNHVNNACYLNYFELGRVKYFNDVFKEHINWNEKGFVLARTELDHLEAIFLTDEVYCFTKVVKTGTKSLTLKNSVVKKINGELIECASGVGVLVAMDYIQQQSIELPAKWVELIRNFEKEF